jgi:hypothetical protein
VTTRTSRPGIIAAATALVSSDRKPRGPAGDPQGRVRYLPNLQEVHLDEEFRNLLAGALIARRRAQILAQPELMLLRATWDAAAWARTEADELLAYIRAGIAPHGV